MERKLTTFLAFYLAFGASCFSQVDTAYVYQTGVPYGALDIRIAKSPTNYYYLQDGTLSFRESAPGVRTNTFFDMTAWDSGPYTEGQLREKTNTGDNFVMNFRLLPPEDYNAGYAEGYPMAVMLHGFGERGNCQDNNCYHATPAWSPLSNEPAAPTDPDNPLMNNDHNLLHGGARHLAAVKHAAGRLPDDPSLDEKSFPGFVLFPQNLNGWDHFAVQDVIRIVRLLTKKYNIDEDRIYIEGLSNGGHGLYEAIKRAPWLFASAIAMSAVDDGYINTQGVAQRIAHIPLWIFQGGKDVNPLPSKTRRYMQQFESVGADIRYTFYPEIGHGTWNKAFNDPEFFTWMLGQNKADIHSFEGSTAICSEAGTRLELAKGFFAYQWEYDGQIIPGADSAVFFAKSPGQYRARFARVANPTEAQWNQWSKPLELQTAAPPVATVRQVGTVVLRDLNNGTDAVLRSEDTHSQYHWYKNGSPLNLPGNEDDTMNTVTLTPAHGNGVYTLVVSDMGCRSVASDPVYVFFGNSAPLNITAPTNFEGISATPAENTLTWTDASDNEGGFEIWRRKQVGSSWSSWEMVTITAPNVTSFDDTGVEPTVSYQYKIRAVSHEGRSDYTPSEANTGLVVNTLVDEEPPSAPSALTASIRGVERFQLTWNPATDNTRIRGYVVYFNDDSVVTTSPDTTFMLTNLAVNTDYNVSVRAIDLSHNLGPESEPIEVSTYFSGLYYEHTTGAWTDLESVDWSWAEVTGLVSDFTLSPKTQEDYYNFSFDGYLLVTEGGDYTFRTTSSDGSKLWIDEELVVDNDGIHGVETLEGATVSLAPGPHRIYLRYFAYTLEDSLSVAYSGPDTGNEWTDVSIDVLKSDESIITAIGNPDDGPEDSFVVSIYPNPTTQDNINVMVETVWSSPVRVRLMDLTGSNLFEQIFQAEDIVHGVNVTPYGTMHTGMYLIAVEQEGYTIREKVIVRR